MVLFVTPTAVELSVWIGDFAWGQPILMRVWRRGGIQLAVMNRADSLALAAEDMTNLIISAMARTGPLKAGVEVVLGKGGVGTSEAAPLGLIKVPDIGIGEEQHAAGTVCDVVVGVGSDVVQELVDDNASGLSDRNLLGANGAEGDKEFVVGGVAVPIESANNALGVFDTGVV